MKKVFARSTTVDLVEYSITIDGVKLPWHLREEPEFEVLDTRLIQMNISILIDGCVSIKTPGNHRVIDPVLGDVGEYARKKVRAEFIRAFPWLRDV